MEDKNKEVQAQKKTDAKNLSKWAQVIAAGYIGYFSSNKFLRMDAGDIKVSDIVLAALAIAGCFSPTFVSIWLDKFIAFKQAMTGVKQ